MKKSIKLIAATLATLTAMSCTSATAFADKLKSVDGVTYRYSDSGEQVGKYTGWATTSKGRLYYKNGLMLKKTWLKTKSGKRYYAGSDGYIVTGWKEFKNGWHWFDSKGVEATGIVIIDGNEYSFSSSGVWDGIAPTEKADDINPSTDYSQIFKIDGRNYVIDVESGGHIAYITKSGKLTDENGKSLPGSFSKFDINTCKSLGKLEKYGDGNVFINAEGYLLPDKNILVMTNIEDNCYDVFLLKVVK